MYRLVPDRPLATASGTRSTASEEVAPLVPPSGPALRPLPREHPSPARDVRLREVADASVFAAYRLLESTPRGLQLNL